MFRSMCMRANYLSSDRPDISFSSKEAARFMASPCVGGEQVVKRICRFLKDHPRCVQRMERQRPPSCISVYSDSDHAGCVRS
eukprot:2264600-Amphidinium_carterae.3